MPEAGDLGCGSERDRLIGQFVPTACGVAGGQKDELGVSWALPADIADGERAVMQYQVARGWVVEMLDAVAGEMEPAALSECGDYRVSGRVATLRTWTVGNNLRSASISRAAAGRLGWPGVTGIATKTGA